MTPIVVGISVVFVTVFVCCQLKPSLVAVLIVAAAIRLALVWVHNNIMLLPDGTADAVMFQDYAEDWARGGFGEAIQEFPGAGAFFYSWILALWYVAFDASVVLGQLLSVAIGVICVYLCYSLTFCLWGDRAVAVSAAWCAALFPNVIQYSALTMREPFIVCAVLCGMLCFVRWLQRPNIIHMVGAFGAFVVAGFFHGAMFLALPLSCVIASYAISTRHSRHENGGTARLIGVLGLLISLALVAFYLQGELELPYLGSSEELLDKEGNIQRIDYAARDGAQYPEWLLPQSLSGILFTLPARFAYLLGAPFPWDVKSTAHVIGLADGCLYMVLCLLIALHWRALKANKGAYAVLLLTASLLLIYALGTSNFGTGARHRAKFADVLIALAAPSFPGAARRSIASTKR
jgi:4-amino-4-deoxy-L-arabinose transferase-like glycosyltransferase